jgi:hypothetical protein
VQIFFAIRKVNNGRNKEIIGNKENAKLTKEEKEEMGGHKELLKSAIPSIL